MGMLFLAFLVQVAGRINFLSKYAYGFLAANSVVLVLKVSVRARANATAPLPMIVAVLVFMILFSYKKRAYVAVGLNS